MAVNISSCMPSAALPSPSGLLPKAGAGSVDAVDVPKVGVVPMPPDKHCTPAHLSIFCHGTLPSRFLSMSGNSDVHVSLLRGACFDSTCCKSLGKMVSRPPIAKRSFSRPEPFFLAFPSAAWIKSLAQSISRGKLGSGSIIIARSRSSNDTCLPRGVSRPSRSTTVWISGFDKGMPRCSHAPAKATASTARVRPWS
jgi:hypothetical protein